MNSEQKPYICIEGVIGAGKTSLCNRLSEGEKCRLILEEFDENPFLQAFYEKPYRYAFPVELFFMKERVDQLNAIFTSGDIFADFYLADYFFPKTSIFATENLSPAESKLFKDLFRQLSRNIPSPTLLIYLSRPIEILMQNIIQRGRPYEVNITRDYLLKLDRAYRQYLNGNHKYRILVYDLEEEEIFERKLIEHFKAQISCNQEPGLEVINVKDWK